MTNFESVKKFMQTFGQEVSTKAGFPNDKIISLRLNLIREEFSELEEAIEKKDIKEVADALTDILYVTYGAGHAFGINLDKCFEEVQNSNMSKLGSDGKPIYNEKNFILWKKKWEERIKLNNNSLEKSFKIMSEVNPLVIPRNYFVEDALKHAVEMSDLNKVHELLKVLKNPYDNISTTSDYQSTKLQEENYVTFCGT